MNNFKSFDVNDPFDENFVEKGTYDIFGIINANIEICHIDHKKLTLHRVPIRLGVKGRINQAIIEIWSKETREEPRFTRDWFNYQLAFIRDVIFIGHREKCGLKFMKFCLPSGGGSRYIALTAEDNFWIQPVSKHEGPSEYKWAKMNQSSFRGNLRLSTGSVFGDVWKASNRVLHTHDAFGRTKFSSWEDEVLTIKHFMLIKGHKLRTAPYKKEFFSLKDGPLFMYM